MKYDVIIVGGACAGLTAGLYAGRRALKALIITKDIGGQAAITTEIENYPGTGNIGGPVLMNKFKEQAEKAGAEIKFAEVMKIEKNNDGFVVKTTDGDLEALTVILAFGLKHREIGVPGERELTGRGVTYCATCDGPLFKGKTVAVVGGGNSAFDAADYLGEMCENVYLIHHSDQYRAEKPLIEAVQAKVNIEILNFTKVNQVVGEKKLEKVIIENVKDNSTKELPLNGLFIEIGYQTQTDFVKELVNLDERGYIITDNQGLTSVPGVFAAGDVTNTPYKQVVISAGEGAKAALSAAKYVQNLKGATAVAATPDWTRRKR